MRFWIDLTSLPHVSFFRALIKRLSKLGHELLVTSREFGVMNEMLRNHGIEYENVGSHGGKDLSSKLIHSSKRVTELAKLMHDFRPELGMSKHSVECSRVCFGLQIPSINVIDHETAVPAMRLMVPLSDHIIAPSSTPVRFLKGMGARDVRQFRGVCETAHFYDFEPDPGILDRLGLERGKKIIIARSEPMLSSHNDRESILFAVLSDIKERFPDCQVVFIPRSDSEHDKLKGLSLVVPDHAIDTLSLYSSASLMIGAGSCMNREACIGGCPTISICPDKLPGVDKMLIERRMMWHALKEDRIVKIASDILGGRAKSVSARKGKGGFEDPYKHIMGIISGIAGN